MLSKAPVMIFSPTGEKHGSGSDPYRWVSGLTDEERQAVKDSKMVIIGGAPTHAGHLPVRKVIYGKGRWDCRTIADRDEARNALVSAGYDPAEFGL